MKTTEEQFTPEELEKARAAKAAYMREYRQREQVKKREKARNVRYWLEKAEEMERDGEPS